MGRLLQLGCAVLLVGSSNAPLDAQMGTANLGPSGFPAVEIQTPSLAAIKGRAQLRGMRVRAIRWDGVLHQNWAVLEDVQHPERPLRAELTDPIGPLLEGVSSAARSDAASAPGAIAEPALPKPAVVHYGDKVRLWRMEQEVRIEMTATAETNAAVGEQVKLRIPGAGTDGDAGWRLIGIVRGPGEAEMER